MEGRYFRLRVTYEKSGRLAMLSHLEMTHALERMVRRAGLPFAMTQGFSPHMRLSFGSALPVGVGSTCEVFDVVLDRYVAPARALEALGGASASGLGCVSCEYVEPSAKAASVAFPYSVYVAEFDAPISGIDVPPTIDVVRRKGTRTIVTKDHLVCDPVIDGNAVAFQLHNGDNGTLRPDVLVSEATLVASDGSAAPSLLSMTRISQSDAEASDIAGLMAGSRRTDAADPSYSEPAGDMIPSSLPIDPAEGRG